MPLEDASIASESFGQLDSDGVLAGFPLRIARSRSVGQFQKVLVEAFLASFGLGVVHPTHPEFEPTTVSRRDLYLDVHFLSGFVSLCDDALAVLAASFVQTRFRQMVSVAADAAFTSVLIVLRLTE